MAAPRFLGSAPDAQSHLVTLADDEAHHARRVLRLGRGDTVRVFDGLGHEWEGTIHESAARSVTVAVARAVDVVPEPAVEVTLAVGVLKGDQMDTVVRESTALGVSVIVPLVSSRVVAPSRARTEAAHARWRRVAVQSAKQCGRAVVPTLGAPAKFADVLTDASYDVRIMLAEPGTGAGTTDDPAPAKPTEGPSARPRAVLLVGPEGGWSADEVGLAASHGVHRWRLGPRTIRAELVPTVALAALWTIWGWS
jgi:16S rRNA (uracil1498-N3)-methyltransferase